MEERRDCAKLKDATIGESMEECVESMGQRSDDATKKDAQTMPRTEECAEGMGQRSNYATVMDAQIKLRKEECALGMGQTQLSLPPHRENYYAEMFRVLFLDFLQWIIILINIYTTTRIIHS